jgi:hypothetical protein
MNKGMKEQLAELEAKSRIINEFSGNIAKQKLQVSKEISALEAKITEEAVTYSIGDRLCGSSGEKVIIVRVWLQHTTGKGYTLSLARLDSGLGWNGQFDAKNISKITLAEIGRDMAGLTRYWDNRKQEEVSE